MKCPIETPENAGVLLDYCAGKLDADTAAGLERHFADCGHCRDWVAAQKNVWAALDAWEVEPAGADFDARLYRRIGAEAREGVWGRLAGWLPRLGFRPALPLALACSVLLAFVLLRTPPPAPPTLGSLDADRLERALDDVEMLRQLNPGAL